MRRLCIHLLLAGSFIALTVLGGFSDPMIAAHAGNVRKEHAVKQGQAPRYLGINEDEGFCFITGVTGKFEGGGEAIRVYVDRKGNWILEVRSRQRGVTGWARCVRFD